MFYGIQQRVPGTPVVSLVDDCQFAVAIWKERSWNLGAGSSESVSIHSAYKYRLLISSSFLSILRQQTDNHPPMKQPESLELVAEFHKTFKHPIQPKPVIPDENRCKLRVALIAEELKELEVAILEKDM